VNSFVGAFKVSGGIYRNGDTREISVTVGKGTVNGYEPIVRGRAISGTGSDGRLHRDGPPVITGRAEFRDRRCFVCIKVKVDMRTGKMPLPPGEENLTVVISKNIKNGESPEYWLHPIALFTEPYTTSEGVEVSSELHQIAYFNLMHYVSRPMYIMPVLGFEAGATDRIHHYLAAV
jgi:hypothetical protein